MNKVGLLLALTALFLGCKSLQNNSAGGAGVEFAPMQSDWDVPQWRSGQYVAEGQPTQAEADSLAPKDTTVYSYLGKWTGEAYITYEYRNLVALDGFYTLELDIQSPTYAIAWTDALEEMGYFQRLALKIYMESELINIDWDNTRMDAGEIATSGLRWEETDDPNGFN